ncbi:MAG: type II secretion system secretin GspD [Cellvibrionaceae bacterium]
MRILPHLLLSAVLSAAVIAPAIHVPHASAEDTITLNFQDADIKAVINTVADLTGKTFIIDPRVKGKVNVISKQPLSRKDVYGAFLSILEVHGFITVKVGQAIKIIPSANSKSSPQPVLSDLNRDGDELVTHVLALQYVSAQELVPILRPILDKSGHLAAYTASNSLIIADYASNIHRLLEIVKRVDKNTEQEIEIIPLQHALGSEVVRLVERLIPNNPKDPAGKLSIGVDERSNSVLISGSKGKRLELRALISHLDTPVESGGNTQVVYLRYANAENVAKILEGVSNSMATGPKKGANPQKDIHIQADKESNALVITAPQAKFKSLRSVIQKLDAPRAQVHIEAIIAEVRFDDSLELGVEWFARDSSRSIDGLDLPIAGTNFNQGIVGTLGGTAEGALNAIGSGLNVAVGRVNDLTSFGALLKAMASDDLVNVLSTPSLTTLDNQEAEISVGENVPFVSGEFTTGTSGASNPFRTIERKDVGISLKVKPQINEGDAITLSIEQDTSSVSSKNVSGASDLITNKRTIKTNVLVGNGEMIVLGGLVTDDFTTSKSKVPLLGSIPLLGRLFSYEKTVKFKRNLMVFLRPVIIRDPSHGRQISQSKYTLLQQQQERVMKKKQLDILPKLGDFPEPIKVETEEPEAEEDTWATEDDI